MANSMEDINEIEDGLFLSSRRVAQTEDILASNGITHILTIDTWPLPQKCFIMPENYIFKFLCKNDEEDVDLLSHFEECNEFIRSGEKVLVHCYVGKSRSATIVLAFLMNKHRISFEDALARVNARRRVSPNDGFCDQLKLYEEMGFSVNRENLSYRLLYLTSIAPQVGSYVGFGNLPAEDQQKVESLLTVRDKLDILCRHCRHPLASSECVIPHVKRRKVTWRTMPKNTAVEVDVSERLDCSEEFMMPSKKVMGLCPGVAGKIYCPKCTSKVGRFAWLGLYCDCGAGMFPGFVLSISKIDRKLPETSFRLDEISGESLARRGDQEGLDRGEATS